jgi:hypothetical protein
MLEWCARPTDRLSIYWLAGHAGTGKSSIAKTLCENLVNHSHPSVVTFFASKNSEERRDPFRILHTIACELAFTDSRMRKHILGAVRSYPDVRQCSLIQQIQRLLLPAAEETVGVRSIIIVIDALDECAVIHGVEGGTLIRDLSEVLAHLPVKIVVTSRMENTLRRMFESLPSQITKLLHVIEGDRVTEDVRLILTHGLRAIAAKHITATSPQWPVEREIDTLVERTGRFIIFAATVLKFLDSDRFSPQAQLVLLLERTSVLTTSDEYAQVDGLYQNVLEAAARRSSNTMRVDPVLSTRLQTLVGTIILLQEALSISSLAQLMHIPVHEVDGDVRALSAVLLVGPDCDNSGSPLVRIFHPSFRDFILERCNDQRFSIDTSHQQHLLAFHCLRILNATLTRDICDIKNPTIPHAEVAHPTLSVRLQQNVPEAVRYASQFWISHISESRQPDASLLSTLQHFVSQHMLHWIEILSLNDHISYVRRHFFATIAWIKVRPAMLFKG